MLQTVNKTKVKDSMMLDRVLTVDITSRVERLRKVLLSGETGISIDRARIETRVMKETEGELMVTRRAKVFAAVVREMPIDISPDELIVGCFSGKPLCWNVSPVDGPGLEKTLLASRPRKDAGWTGGAGLINFSACMEYVLTNGVRRASQLQQPDTTDRSE